MAKKDNSRIPGGIDINALIAKGQQAEQKFKSEASQKLDQKINTGNEIANNSIIETVDTERTADTKDLQNTNNETVADTLQENVSNQSTISESEVKPKTQGDNLKQKSQSKGKEEDSLIYDFEEFLKPCIKAKGQVYAAGYIKEDSMKIFKMLNAIEGVNVTDMLNNIVSAWLHQNRKEIVSRIQQGARNF